jgi:hypothetical protein
MATSTLTKSDVDIASDSLIAEFGFSPLRVHTMLLACDGDEQVLAAHLAFQDMKAIGWV